jgi:hypothetical protein
MMRCRRSLAVVEADLVVAEFVVLVRRGADRGGGGSHATSAVL